MVREVAMGMGRWESGDLSFSAVCITFRGTLLKDGCISRGMGGDFVALAWEGDGTALQLGLRPCGGDAEGFQRVIDYILCSDRYAEYSRCSNWK